MRWVFVAHKVARVCEVRECRVGWAREGTVFGGSDGAMVLECFFSGDKSIHVSGEEGPRGYALVVRAMAGSAEEQEVI
jgi:hypothetical protein